MPNELEPNSSGCLPRYLVQSWLLQCQPATTLSTIEYKELPAHALRIPAIAAEHLS